MQRGHCIYFWLNLNTGGKIRERVHAFNVNFMEKCHLPAFKTNVTTMRAFMPWSVEHDWNVAWLFRLFYAVAITLSMGRKEVIKALDASVSKLWMEKHSWWNFFANSLMPLSYWSIGTIKRQMHLICI